MKFESMLICLYTIVIGLLQTLGNLAHAGPFHDLVRTGTAAEILETCKAKPLEFLESLGTTDEEGKTHLQIAKDRGQPDVLDMTKFIMMQKFQHYNKAKNPAPNLPLREKIATFREIRKHQASEETASAG